MTKMYIESDIGYRCYVKNEFFSVSIKNLYLLCVTYLGIGDLRLTKRQAILLNTEKSPCHNYISSTFSSCALKVMTKMILSTHIDCIIPEWNNLEVLYNIPVCANLNATTYDDINHEIGQINKKFVSDHTNPNGCPLPCTLTKYNPTVLNFDYKAMTFQWQKYTNVTDLYILLIYYISTETEIKRQYFVYDFLTIISAIGGTLGLLLGYSFLSIMLSVIHYFE